MMLREPKPWIAFDAKNPYLKYESWGSFFPDRLMAPLVQEVGVSAPASTKACIHQEAYFHLKEISSPPH